MNVMAHDRLWSSVRVHHQYRQLKRILELVDVGSWKGEMQMLCCGLLAFSYIYDNFSMSILITSFTLPTEIAQCTLSSLIIT